MSKEQEHDGLDFSSLTVGKLREYANHLRVAVAKDATKATIIDALNSKLRTRTVPELAEEGMRLKPGYAKIRVHENPNSSKQIPVYLFDNGYEVTIPRGVEVIVPARVIDALNNSVVKRRKQVEGEPGMPPSVSEIMVHSYPFTVLEINPGPRVLTKREEIAAKQMGPRRRYRAMFGRWPRPRELTRAIEQKFIDLHSDEHLGTSEERFLETKD